MTGNQQNPANGNTKTDGTNNRNAYIKNGHGGGLGNGKGKPGKGGGGRTRSGRVRS